MKLAPVEVQRELLRLARLRDEMDDLDAACIREGGFLTCDPRCDRLLAVGREHDELEMRLMAAQEGVTL